MDVLTVSPESSLYCEAARNLRFIIWTAGADCTLETPIRKTMHMNSAASGATDSPSHDSHSEIIASRVNLDAGGNSRISELGRSAYMQALEDGWADHRRLHTEGRRARSLFDASRETIAGVLGARTDEIHIAPSATAALHSASAALYAGRARVSKMAVMSAVERSALINAAMQYGEHTLVDVDSQGRVDVDGFALALQEGPTAFAAIQQANHEVGTIQPVSEIAEHARTAQVPLLVDASATIGHIGAPARTDWDALVANPADWGAGSGVGVLALKPRTRTRRTWPEDQDAWFPGGTSLPALFAAAVTLAEAEQLRSTRQSQHRAWIDDIRVAAARIPDAEVVGDPHNRLPHLATFSFLYVDGEAITSELDRFGFAVGSGSACTSATLHPSHVLSAMGVLTHGNVRVALDWDVTRQDVERFIEVLPHAVRSVRSLMGADDL